MVIHQTEKTRNVQTEKHVRGCKLEKIGDSERSRRWVIKIIRTAKLCLHMYVHVSSKQIMLENHDCSDFEANSRGFKTKFLAQFV